MLLGEGLSSPPSAESLTLSASTDEGRINRAIAQTGTNSRDELAAFASAPAAMRLVPQLQDPNPVSQVAKSP